MWREQPADFWIDGMNPLEEVFERGKKAWQGEEIMMRSCPLYCCVLSDLPLIWNLKLHS